MIFCINSENKRDHSILTQSFQCCDLCILNITFLCLLKQIHCVFCKLLRNYTPICMMQKCVKVKSLSIVYLTINSSD